MEPVKVQAKGLAIAIHFDDENYVEKIGDKCEKAGLIVSVEDETILLFLRLLSTSRPRSWALIFSKIAPEWTPELISFSRVIPLPCYKAFASGEMVLAPLSYQPHSLIERGGEFV